MARRFLIPCFLSAFALFAVLLLSLFVGSVPIDSAKILTPGSLDNIIFFSLRLPRVFASILSGLAFSVSGLLIQKATGNALSSPNIIGVNSGAGAAVLLFLSFFPSLFALLPVFAFIGSTLALVMVFSISLLTRRVDSSISLILSGVAVNALFNAVISTISSINPDVMATYSSFSIGGFSGIYYSQLKIPSLLIILSFAASFFLCKRMDVLALGDEMAASMGYRPTRIRMTLILTASIMASSAVTFSGLLGFVGLVTPHIAFFLSSGKSRQALILSSLIGPALVTLSDLLGRTVLSPSELPAGIFMAVIGVPFFIFLLLRRLK